MKRIERPVIPNNRPSELRVLPLHIAMTTADIQSYWFANAPQTKPRHVRIKYTRTK